MTTNVVPDDTNASNSFTLQLLHASDFEAAIPALEDAPRFSAVLNALRNQDNDENGEADYQNTLFLSSGDNYIPGVWSFASNEVYGSQGRADIAILNELGLQASALGNHEFDLGTGVVANVLAPDPEDGYGGAQFPYLSANLNFSSDTNLDDFVTEDGQEASEIGGKIAKSTFITVNGEKIGIVGATTPILRSISSPGGTVVTPAGFPQNPTDADIQALADIIQASVDQLLADNPDINKVILLSHMQQISIEEALAEKLQNVDIIVAGGSHTRLLDETDRLRSGDTTQGDYPIFKTDVEGNPIAIVNTDANYKYVGRLVIDFDANGLIIPDSYDPEISGAYATDEAGVAAVGGTPDPEVVAITEALQAQIAELEGNVFGLTNEYLNGNRAGGGVDGVRNQETNLGNLTADANLAIAKDYDPNVVISLKNGGGIRNSIGQIEVIGTNEPERLPPAGNELTGKPEGGISQLDIANALSFNNGLSLVTVTAQELLDILEYGIGASTNDPASSQGRFPQVGGLAFSFDLDLPTGDRIQSLAIKDSEGNTIDIVVRNGELVGNPNRTFRMVTLSFLADGGDGYSIPERDRIDLTQPEEAPRTGNATFAADGSEQDALAEYLSDNFLETPFDREDTPRELDQRIQNLDFRQDSVLADVPVLPKVVNGTSGDDYFDSVFPDDKNFAGDEQVLFTGSGDDYVDVTFALGANRIDTGSGDDLIFGGTNNRIFAGSGDDLIFVGSGGGNNVITGGAGADQFWVVTDIVDLPAQGNTITDFRASGGDVIGFANTDLSFSDLTLIQSGRDTLIQAFDQDIAKLLNIQASSLIEANFVFA